MTVDTEHDYAVPAREYHLDLSSPIPASPAADPVLDQKIMTTAA